MAKYRKKPAIIEAVQLKWSTWNEVCEIAQRSVSKMYAGEMVGPEDVVDTCGEPGPEYIAVDIQTLESHSAPIRATHGDYIILGVAGELYPCKPDIFEATHELIEHYDY